MMSRMIVVLGALVVLVVVTADATGQEKKTSPADGYTIHVTAPHVVAGKVMGPYHHYCKIISPEPVIECLCYDSSDTGARLQQVEYIVAIQVHALGR